MTATPGLREPQVSKAVAALLKFLGKQREESKNLLQEDEFLHLVSKIICIRWQSLGRLPSCVLELVQIVI